LLNILLVDVVPAALVVSEGEVLRKGSSTGEGGVLVENVERGRPEEDDEVEDAGFGDPMSRGSKRSGSVVAVGDFLALLERRRDRLGRRSLGDIDPGLGGGYQEDGDGRTGAVSLHEGDGAVLYVEWKSVLLC
jgi:hypothetical protein